MKPALDLLRKRDNVFEKRDLIAAPVEVVEKRTERSKTFSIGPNTFHLSQSIGPVHYKDENGDWQEIDLSFRAAETEAGLVYRMDKAAYIAEVFTDRVGWRHTSREGWWRQVELLAIDGRPVEYGGTVRVNDNVVLYDGVAPGVDMKVCAYRLKSEVFKKLEQPCELTWRVTASDGAGGTFQEKTAGWDKGGDTLEMVTRLEGETFTERWTGRVSKVVDKRTRRKAWTTEPEYPVVVDASITEDIANVSDDGGEEVALSGARWDALGNTYGPTNSAKVGMASSGGQYQTENHGGFRWQGIAIPAGSTVSAATLSLTVASLQNSPLTRIYGDDVDDAAAWSAANRPSQITKTTAYKQWNPVANGAQTVDVLAPLAEVLGRGGWASGNDARVGILNNYPLPVTITAGSNYHSFRVLTWGTQTAPPAAAAQIDITYTAGASAAGPLVAGKLVGRGILGGRLIA